MSATGIATMVGITLLVTSPVPTEPGGTPAPAGTQLDLDRRAGGDFETADSELSAVYQQILTEYADDATFIAKLEAAERAWLALRDAELAATFPHMDDPSYYGSVLPMCLAARKTELTRARTADLRRWLRGTSEGDACAGALKTRTKE